MRKKRLIVMIIVVVFCALFLSVVGHVMLKKDEEEYARWQAGYKGLWTDESEQYQVTVYRVTSAHMIFSIEYERKHGSLSFATAVATEEGEYTFTYDVEAYKENGVDTTRLCYGKRLKGNFVLKEQELQVDIMSANNNVRSPYAKDIGFKGSLKKKESLPQENIADLFKFMGKAKPQDYQEGVSLYYLGEQEGKVSHIHIVWDNNREKTMGYMFDEINPYCMVFDLQNRFGSPIAEEKLDDHRHKYVYEEEGYRYQFITEGYGLVVEADCQLIEPLRGQKKGDFIVEGDTVLRYLGDYEKQRKIKLPEGTKRIATGAFTVGDAALSDSCTRVAELLIPKDVKVDPYAFRNCGKLKIELEEGWETVEEESFAGMVSEKRQYERFHWVDVTLPSTVRRLKIRAFAIEVNGLSDDYLYFGDRTTDYAEPVMIHLNSGLEYIEDDALQGIRCDEIPRHLIEVGTNFYIDSKPYLYDSYAYRFPASLKRIKRSTLLSPGRWVILEGALPEMTGELNYSSDIFLDEDEEGNTLADDTFIELKDKKDEDELIRRLTEGQHLTEKEKKEIEKMLDQRWLEDDDWDDDW